MLLNSRTPLILILGVGVVNARNSVGNHDNKKPMKSQEDKVRICADLCSSGLGGESCGAFCKDLLPKLSVTTKSQSKNTFQNVRSGNLTRSDACPVLCKNGLGYPFCKCQSKQLSNLLIKPNNNNINKNIEDIDFKEICGYYCKEQRWWLRGCPACKITFKYGGKENGDEQPFLKIINNNYAVSNDVDWNKWCDLQCANSNGGSACNCDLLPFSLI